jgi:hypothetical protein
MTDFGVGPYIGQIRLMLAERRALPVVDLIADLAAFRPDLAAYLLPGLVRHMPARTLYLCVVDPGVGTDRAILAACLGTDWFLGPDNGLLVPLVRARRDDAKLWRLAWRPAEASATFHGRDVFMPMARQIAAGFLPAESTFMSPGDMVGADHMPPALAAVCYVDHYGNVISGTPARNVATDAVIALSDKTITRARTFGDVAVGHAFWYENAFGLVEIAVNQGRADVQLGLRPGDPLRFSG